MPGLLNRDLAVTPVTPNAARAYIRYGMCKAVHTADTTTPYYYPARHLLPLTDTLITV